MRSSHRKSRHGCRECKQRHKKCDESSPICLNCSITNRSCSYRHTRPSHRAFQTKPAAPPLTPSPSPSPSPSAVLPYPQWVTQEWRAQEYSMGHLELLHHLESPGLGHEEASILPLPSSIRRVMMQCALANPFLMDQVLALSAAHLSTVHRGQQQAFLNKATELQTRALTLFNRSESAISQQNSCAWFLYSSLLGLQVMFETYQSNDLDSFLDQLSTYIPVHQGVHAVVQKAWPTVKDIVRGIVGYNDFSGSRGLGKRQPQECDDLVSLIDECDLGESDKDICLEAIEILQWIFEIYRISPPTQVHFTVAWSMLVPARDTMGAVVGMAQAAA
ncbi:transcriptional regulator family: Fungal Specific TF [Trichoderma aggressivum f. europaeum]|uniref:Transcriptional regulator family: Fungal Specific TF n=1 Tax=Trichoderma aggressivum f. europaeum TaxID=173218 RepID=A0AAE1LW46_9HYPO|nr:transcriptional regulator family: Fungal Specific TF [Trichoderma aggressivum f. europaeum]